MYKKSILRNGLKIITHNMPKMQSIALGVWIATGGRYETAQKKGISHYLEHLLFKGSKKYSCRKIKESIEGVGGSLNGFTSEEMTCFLAKLPGSYTGLALNILSDMVINPLLAQQDIERERTVILEEAKMYRDLPQSYVHELLDELLWPKQPLGMSIIGSDDSIKSIDRKQLGDYQENYYTPVNILVSATGRIEHESLIKKTEGIFSKLSGGISNIFQPVIETQTGSQLNVFYKDTEQTHLAMGFHGFKRGHPLKHSQTLLHIVLGANMSSRLFNELREKRGLAYEIGTQVKRFQDTGAFLVHAGIDNSKVSEALRLIMEELKKIKTGVVKEDEFARAKEFYLGQLMLALEDTLDHMLWIGESTMALDRAYTLKEIIREVNAVTPKDMLEAARIIFKEKSLNLALIGPLKDKEDSISKLLKI